MFIYIYFTIYSDIYITLVLQNPLLRMNYTQSISYIRVNRQLKIEAILRQMTPLVMDPPPRLGR